MLRLQMTNYSCHPVRACVIQSYFTYKKKKKKLSFYSLKLRLKDINSKGNYISVEQKFILWGLRNGIVVKSLVTLAEEPSWPLRRLVITCYYSSKASKFHGILMQAVHIQTSSPKYTHKIQITLSKCVLNARCL